jgi:high-affinity iron transporter
MIPSFLLALREGLEAALILGIVLGVLNRLKRPHLRPIVWRGALAAAALAAAIAVLLSLVGMKLEGPAEQIFEGVTMLLAAGVLTWMIFWMQRQGGAISGELAAETGRVSAGRGGSALFALAFLAVFREGLELALFLLAAQMTSSPMATLGGALTGLAGAAGLGWLLFSSTRRLNVKRFFQVTNVLLIIFAAGLVGYGVHELNEAGWIPAIVEHLYNINPILNEDSTLGIALKTLIGYNGNPSLSETIAYLGYFLTIALALGAQSRRIPARRPSVAD